MQAAFDGVWTRHIAHRSVRDALSRARTVRSIHPVSVAASTQDVARGLAAKGAESGTLVLTDHQTDGRGRGGRRWDDLPDGGTLALTVLLDAEDLGEVALAPHALGLAMVDAFAAALPAAPHVRLKWPNDVVHRGGDGSTRKLCGILIERDRVAAWDALLCGVGIDVDLRAAGEAVDRTCLAALAGAPPEPARLIAAIITGIDDALELLAESSTLLDRYRAASDTIGRMVRVEPVGAAPIVGRAEDIDETGRLVVTTGGRRHAILSGTVRDVEGTEERTS